MTREIRGKSDGSLVEIMGALALYEAKHPQAQIVAYRQNSASVRVRIVDPDFSGTNKSQRHDLVWTYLAELSEETQSQVSILLLLTPDEVETSFANFEFDDPIPSQL